SLFRHRIPPQDDHAVYGHNSSPSLLPAPASIIEPGILVWDTLPVELVPQHVASQKLECRRAGSTTFSQNAPPPTTRPTTARIGMRRPLAQALRNLGPPGSDHPRRTPAAEAVRRHGASAFSKAALGAVRSLWAGTRRTSQTKPQRSIRRISRKLPSTSRG